VYFLIDKISRSHESGTLIDITIITGSRKEGIKGVDKWRKRLVLRIKEQPIDGRGNGAIVKFFSSLFAIPSNGVRIVSGERSSQKTIFIDLQKELVMSRLQSSIPKIDKP
jgi:uncharacterized protein (TIGR00251 family)